MSWPIFRCRLKRGVCGVGGAVGVGKSTLLRLLAGLLRPSTGQINLAGQPASEAHDPIGLVFQRDNLMPWRTVTENVRLPLELLGRNGRVHPTARAGQ